jgi:DNA-binding MarR family transcriptional regulator
VSGETNLLHEMFALVRGIDRVHSSGQLIVRSGVQLERVLHPVVMTVAELQPIRITELAVAMALDSSTVSRHAARLQQMGLLQRTVDPDDGRASLLTLSAEGRRIHAALMGAWAGILAEQLEAAGSGSADDLAAQLRKVSAALELLAVPGENRSRLEP